MFDGKKLEARRKELGLTRDKLATAAGLKSQETIRVWELGHTDPSVSKLEGVAAVLRVPVLFFLDGKNEDGKSWEDVLRKPAPDSFFSESDGQAQTPVQNS